MAGFQVEIQTGPTHAGPRETLLRNSVISLQVTGSHVRAPCGRGLGWGEEVGLYQIWALERGSELQKR